MSQQTRERPVVERFGFLLDAHRGLVALRIGTGLGVLGTVAARQPWHWTPERIPDAFRDVEGPGGAIVALLPRSDAALAYGSVALIVLAGLTIFGVHRSAAFGACVVGLWVLGVPQLYGDTSHYHHLVWLLAFLAMVPGAWQRTRGDLRIPLFLGQAIVASVFFFPGLYKLVRVPAGWVSADAVRGTLSNIRFTEQGGLLPLPPDPLLVLMGVAVIVFEVGFLLAVLWRSSRIAFGVLGFAFQVGTGLFTDLWFWSIIPLYPVFLFGGTVALRDVWAWVRGWAWRTPVGVLVGVIAFTTLATAVIREKGDWPFGLYPTFSAVQKRPVVERLVVGSAERPWRLLGDEWAAWAPHGDRQEFERTIRARPELLALTEIAEPVYVVEVDVLRDEARSVRRL